MRSLLNLLCGFCYGFCILRSSIWILLWKWFDRLKYFFTRERLWILLWIMSIYGYCMDFAVTSSISIAVSTRFVCCDRDIYARNRGLFGTKRPLARLGYHRCLPMWIAIYSNAACSGCRDRGKLLWWLTNCDISWPRQTPMGLILSCRVIMSYHCHAGCPSFASCLHPLILSMVSAHATIFPRCLHL